MAILLNLGDLDVDTDTENEMTFLNYYLYYRITISCFVFYYKMKRFKFVVDESNRFRNVIRENTGIFSWFSSFVTLSFCLKQALYHASR